MPHIPKTSIVIFKYSYIIFRAQMDLTFLFIIISPVGSPVFARMKKAMKVVYFSERITVLPSQHFLP
jgi:hypothetical protein